MMSDSSENIEKNNILSGGLSGLGNLGNTCYMNSALQCLSATNLLVSYFIGLNGSGDYKKDLKYAIIKKLADEKKKKEGDTNTKIEIQVKDINKAFKNSLSYKLKNVLMVMWSVNCIVKPKAFKSKLGKLKEMFAGYDQNDSQECLSFILDQIHEETKTDAVIEAINLSEETLNFKKTKEYYSNIVNDENFPLDERIANKKKYELYKNENLKNDAILKSISFWQKFLKKNHSTIIDIFTGLFFNEIQCLNCKNTNMNFETFNIVSLPIPKHKSTLESCLADYFNSFEKLDDDNKYNCDSCSSTCEATKKISLWHSPSSLIIQLKRFENIFGPITRTIKNTTNILFPINGLDMKPYCSDYINDHPIYDLYAIINHSGSLSGGHYVAYTKNAINGKWYLFDDSNVLHIPQNKLEEEIINSGAYVLFYKKRGNDVIVDDISDDCDGK